PIDEFGDLAGIDEIHFILRDPGTIYLDEISLLDDARSELSPLSSSEPAVPGKMMLINPDRLTGDSASVLEDAVTIDVSSVRIPEDATTPALLVAQRRGSTDQPLRLEISLSDPTELVAPQSVEIPAGLSYVAVP